MEKSAQELGEELASLKVRLAELEAELASGRAVGASQPIVPGPEQVPTPQALEEIDSLKERIAEAERAYGEALAQGR